MARGDARHPLERRLVDAGPHLLAIGSIAALLLPILWMVSTSLKPLEDVFRYPPVWIPERLTLANYRAQASAVLGTCFWNSILVGFGGALLATSTSALAAQALARFRFRGATAILMFFLASLAFPIPLLMISMYLLLALLVLLDTYLSLILGHTVITPPVAVWLLESFFEQLPREVEEAAYVDGASPAYTLLRIVLPMARPALTAAAIFVFVTSWYELLFGLTFTSSDAMRPLPAGIAMSFLAEFEGAWPQTMALAVLVSLPILLLFLFFQRAFSQGVTGGAVKG